MRYQTFFSNNRKLKENKRGIFISLIHDYTTLNNIQKFLNSQNHIKIII